MRITAEDAELSSKPEEKIDLLIKEVEALRRQVAPPGAGRSISDMLGLTPVPSPEQIERIRIENQQFDEYLLNLARIKGVDITVSRDGPFSGKIIIGLPDGRNPVRNELKKMCEMRGDSVRFQDQMGRFC